VVKHVDGEHFFWPLDKLLCKSYNIYMHKNTYTTFRVLKEDAEKLKIIAALSRESMLQSFKRLVQQEYDRLQKEGGKSHAVDEKDQA